MVDNNELVFRLFIGALFGGLIGYERQVHGRPAGFRTHILVALAGVLVMEVSEYYHYLAVQNSAYVRVDPGRIAAGALTGIGFLGAGVIIKLGANVQGLTTAASIWMVSAIGVAIGAGLYVPTTVAFAITFFSLLVLRGVEKITSQIVFKVLTVVAAGELEPKGIRDILTKYGAQIKSTDYERDIEKSESTLRYMITLWRSPKEPLPLRSIADDISALPGIKNVSLKS